MAANWLICTSSDAYEGRAEGRIEKSIEIARKLLAAGYPKEEVMELTGVGVDDI